MLSALSPSALQDQRRADACLDRRMRAGKHQRQAVIRDFLAHRGVVLRPHRRGSATILGGNNLAAGRLRAASTILRRATVMSHASGFAGQPLSGQSASAEANASASASVRAARQVMSLPIACGVRPSRCTLCCVAFPGVQAFTRPARSGRGEDAAVAETARAGQLQAGCA